MENPCRLAAVGAVEIDFENFALLGVDVEVGAVTASSPIFFRGGAGEAPIVPEMSDGDDAILSFSPDEGYGFRGNAFRANGDSLRNQGWHVARIAILWRTRGYRRRVQ